VFCSPFAISHIEARTLGLIDDSVFLDDQIRLRFALIKAKALDDK